MSQTITVTVGQLVNASPALAELASMKLPFLTAYRISRMILRIAPEVEAATKSRENAFRKYGEEQDGKIVVQSSRLAEMEKELIPLLSEEVQLAVEPLPLALFADAPDVQPQLLMALGPFIEE